MLRKILPILTLSLCLAAIYDGWILYSRWQASRAADRERVQAEAARARQTLALLGGDELKILSFYASPATLHPGGHSTICFGVNGAKTVRIDPPVERLHPALSYCFSVSPRVDTTYHLIAEDAAGHTVMQDLTIQVGR